MAEDLLAAPDRRVPDHVPPELVRDIDLSGAGDKDPYEVFAGFHRMGRVFYNAQPRNIFQQDGGIWVLTRAEDIRAALQTPEVFSSQGSLRFADAIGESWRLIPIELDPPEHSQFRAVLNGIFSPAKMKAMEAGVRARAVALIEPFADRAGCEFVEAFAQPFPVSIFMQLMGLPEDHAHQFNRWEQDLLHNQDPAAGLAALRGIVGYLRELIARRRAEPADDLTTFCIKATVDGRPVTEDEIMGMCFLLFIAGLDTVAAALSLQVRHLALNPADQQRLRDNPALIPDAVEELLRRYSIVMGNRVVARDVEFAGVQMKAGERVLCSTVLANLDPQEFEAPLGVDFQRFPNRHVAFLYGPHRCIGSHLARRELVIALEELLARLPPFRVAPGAAVPVQPGGLLGLHDLPLVW